MSDAAPWRALEDVPAGPIGRTSSAVDSATPAPAMARTTWIVAAVGAAAIVAGIAVWLVASGGQGSIVVEGDGPGPVASAAEARTVAVASAKPRDRRIVVDVQGAVLRPGIVELAPGSRIADAIAAAGGFGPRVAADRVGRTLNLAALLMDGGQIVVPSRDDPVTALPTAPPPAGGAGAAGTGPIDLNHATAAELDALPGIGPVTAAKIVAAREEQTFATVEDLRTRKILGAATFDKVKDLVVVR
ncbi:MAG: helix-hairpin-helix domain-containing protein [Candidatus Limnocylindrales bacterium]